ncbi:hypothetical protein ANANG_G00007350 [Anguilla anguilla]|uniref:Uncharacterized protein n=1 Tax=Anguilla anguilla TaxID=7936 RepID=A0A9D3S6A4_ANGAN|nr:hypothetical protein ANANG_G00007350 [Anguilla anguilla]
MTVYTSDGSYRTPVTWASPPVTPTASSLTIPPPRRLWPTPTPSSSLYCEPGSGLPYLRHAADWLWRSRDNRWGWGSDMAR